ncbi:MAG: hypothetical protein QXL67_01240, partial [Candidatus Bathyarchaeia archaeon]
MSILADRLRRQASDLADLLMRRVQELKNRESLRSCIKNIEHFKPDLPFLKRGEYSAVGIDGSMDFDEVLEMLLFYVCATGFRCDFSINDEVKFKLDEVERDERLSASASIPLWAEDLFQVVDETGSTEYDLDRSAERVPFALMTMAELSLAVKAANDERVRLIFLDRPLLGTFSPLARDLRLFLM